MPFSTVNAVAWNGEAWVVGLVRNDNGFVLLLDRRLNVVRTIELGAARSVGLTTIDGAVWAVQQRESDTEVFAVDGMEVGWPGRWRSSRRRSACRSSTRGRGSLSRGRSWPPPRCRWSSCTWHDQNRGVSGTPLRDDGSPHVPGGFVVSDVAFDYGPTISVVPHGFLVTSSSRGIFISPAGTPLLSFPIGPEGAPAAGGELLAWRNGLLLPVAGGEQSVAPWAGQWAPMAIDPIGGGRHLVALVRERMLATSIITITGGRIAGHTPPRLLIDRIAGPHRYAVVGEKPLVAYEENGQVWVTTYPGRRRAAR